METSMIEKLDKSRYELLKWFTVGWGMWYGGFILKDLISSKLILGLILLVGLVGGVIFAVNLIRFRRFAKIVNSDSDLKNALNDELMLHNRNKSYTVGYWVLIIVTGIFMLTSIYTDISALIVCEVILYIGILSVLVSSLRYNKD
ncbi:MAG: hypothetical protein V3V00_01350 [Saprospiraceae bacterium]